MFSVLIFLFFFLLTPLSLFLNDISSITFAHCLIIGYVQNKNNLLQNKYTKKRLISNVARAEPNTEKRNLFRDAENNLDFLQESQYGCTVHAYNNYNLPVTMDINEFGTIKMKDLNSTYNNVAVQSYKIINQKQVFYVHTTMDNKTNYVEMLGDADLTWVDTQISDKNRLTKFLNHFKFN